MTGSEAETIPAGLPELAPGESGIRFDRVRSGRDGRLFGHAAAMVRRHRDGTLAAGPGFAGDGADGRPPDKTALIGFMRRVLSETAAFAKDGAGRTEKGKLIVPIPALALVLKEPASAFTDLCRRHADVFEDRLVVEMCALPAGTNLTLIDDAAIILYAFSPLYLVRVSPAWRDFKVLSNANVHGVSVHLHDPGAATLAEWVEGAKRWRLATLAHGVDGPDDTVAANTLDFDYLSGAAV